MEIQSTALQPSKIDDLLAYVNLIFYLLPKVLFHFSYIIYIYNNNNCIY